MALADVIQKLNKNFARSGLILSVRRWEDAPPGFWKEGVQHHLNSFLEIEDSDLFIGVLWKKFGTPGKDGQSGTEHEFYKAYEAWKENGKPPIMLYFNQREDFPKTPEESEQQTKVLKFKDKIRTGGEGLYIQYSGFDNHLYAFILGKFIDSVVNEPRRLQIERHRHELLKRYSKFHFEETFKACEASWRQYIGSFAFSKIFLQHLCTGRREIYALLDSNEPEFEKGLAHLLQGFSVHTDSLGGVCEDCLRLFDKHDIPRYSPLLQVDALVVEDDDPITVFLYALKALESMPQRLSAAACSHERGMLMLIKKLRNVR